MRQPCVAMPAAPTLPGGPWGPFHHVSASQAAVPKEPSRVHCVPTRML
jgi:hypothetical protein